MALSPERVRAFREDYRRERIGPRYHGWLHLALTSGMCVAAITTALLLIESWRWLDLLVVPLAWLSANLVEYAAHRGPMHHSSFGFAALYRRHTSEHHRFFSRECMAVDGERDLHVTLFPARVVLFFVGLLGLPLALAVGWLLSRDIGLLFYAAIMFYYLVYEWAHLSVHMPEDSLLGRLPGVARARRHHGLHHDPARMRRVNFNFAIPLGDWLFGTWER